MGLYNPGVGGGGNANLGTFNIRNYGASGNGTSDDGVAFNAACQAALAAGGGVVYLPAGNYKMVTNCLVNNGGTPGPRIIIQGEGSATRFIPLTSSNYSLLFLGGCDVSVRDIRFDGTTVGSAAAYGSGVNSTADYLIGFASGRAVVEGCTFNGLCLPVKMIASLDNHTVIRNNVVSMTVYTNTAAASNCYFLSDLYANGWYSLTAYDNSIAEGAIVYPQTGSIFYFGTPIYPLHNSGQQARIDIHRNGVGSASGFSQVYVNAPGGTRVSRVNIEDNSFNVIDHGTNFNTVNNTLMGPIYINRADYVSIRRNWSGWGGVGTYRAWAHLYDAGDVTIEQSKMESDFFYNTVFEGAAFIYADSATRSLKVIDTDYQNIAASCPTTVVASGLTSRVRTGAAVAVNQLVKVSGSTVVPMATTDGAEKCYGVAQQATAKATGTVVFNASFNITEADQFYVPDGVNANTSIVFTLVGGSYPGSVVVNVTNAMTAAQRATALANAVNAAHGAGFQVTANAVGGTVTLTNDNEGMLGNGNPSPGINATAGSVSAVLGAITYSGMGGGINAIRVVEQRGQEVTVINDGATAIAVGDLIIPSGATAGQVKKSGTTTRVGVATSAAAASAGATFTMLFG